MVHSSPLLSKIHFTLVHDQLQYTVHSQPRRVGSFSGGASWFGGGAPYFFQMRKSRITNESRRARTLAGGPGPCGPPDATGLSTPDHCSAHSSLQFIRFYTALQLTAHSSLLESGRLFVRKKDKMSEIKNNNKVDPNLGGGRGGWESK